MWLECGVQDNAGSYDDPYGGEDQQPDNAGGEEDEQDGGVEDESYGELMSYGESGTMSIQSVHSTRKAQKAAAAKKEEQKQAQADKPKMGDMLMQVLPALTLALVVTTTRSVPDPSLAFSRQHACPHAQLGAWDVVHHQLKARAAACSHALTPSTLLMHSWPTARSLACPAASRQSR